MPIDDRELFDDVPSRRRPYGDEDDDKPSSPARVIASVAGVVIVLGVIAGGGWFLWSTAVNSQPVNNGPPATGGGAKPKSLPASRTDFVINAAPADMSRYKGSIDTYLLRGIDDVRRLQATIINRDAALLNEPVPELEGGSGRTYAQAAKANRPPGDGCTVKDVQDYYTRLGISFWELPDDLCWGYDPAKGQVYLGMR